MRRAILKLSYEGVAISADIAPMLKSFSYTDNAAGKADDISLTLHDKNGLWRGDWFPDKGAKVTAGLLCEKWLNGKDISLNFGTFTIDEISANSGDTFTIKGVSAFITKAFRNEAKTRGFEKMTLKAVAEKFASENGFSLIFDSDTDPVMERLDQRNESDLAFLDRLCKSKGMNLKVADTQVIIYSGANYGAKNASFVITPSNPTKSWSFASKAHDTYKSCLVTYYDPKKKKNIKYEYIPPNAPKVGQTLKINTKVESVAEAEARAKAELRLKNSNEVSGSVTLVGSPSAAAGINVSVSGFGRFDGKYGIDTATHTIDGSGGYTTSLSLKTALEY
ncbi:phage late control D family protein [Geovibrio ferrireducens]|uniref:phage late control D family protein n=1 Tax=Geovibrio ferrireducens TaxID=46201 RepID=UPI00224820EF|nr:contractile injection system protein, VgrG/Pvc8 family [Geovibrio ferrireducens]